MENIFFTDNICFSGLYNFNNSRNRFRCKLLTYHNDIKELIKTLLLFIVQLQVYKLLYYINTHFENLISILSNTRSPLIDVHAQMRAFLCSH